MLPHQDHYLCTSKIIKFGYQLSEIYTTQSFGNTPKKPYRQLEKLLLFMKLVNKRRPPVVAVDGEDDDVDIMSNSTYF